MFFSNILNDYKFFFFCLFRSLTVLADRFSAFVMKIKLNRMIWCVLNWSNQSQSHSDACIIRAVCFNNSINRTTSPPRENPNKHYDMQTGKIIRQNIFPCNIAVKHSCTHFVHIAHHTCIYHWHVFICIYFSFGKMNQTKHWFRGKHYTHLYGPLASLTHFIRDNTIHSFNLLWSQYFMKMVNSNNNNNCSGSNHGNAKHVSA